MRLLICAGGTGGGVYPALVALQALASGGLTGPFDVSQSCLWVGGEGGMEADLVRRAGVPYTEIPAAGVAGIGPRTLPGNVWKLLRGFFAARRIIHRFRPDVMLFTGGYVAVPVALASWLPALGMRRPRSLLYVPDIEPGLALKTLARFADHIALTAEESRPYFQGKSAVSVTGYPVRANLHSWDSDQARQVLNLHPDLPTLLVTGGSRGARSINRATLAALPDLLPEMQVVHISGKLDWHEIEQAQANLAGSTGLAPELAARYHPYPYLHEELGAAMTAADLVVTRAGASTLGELPLFGLPAILVPYPYAWRYQKVNANYLADRGAALVVKDTELLNQLVPVVRELLVDQQRLAHMQEAMRSLAQPSAPAALAELLHSLSNGSPKGQHTW